MAVSCDTMCMTSKTDTRKRDAINSMLMSIPRYEDWSPAVPRYEVVRWIKALEPVIRSEKWRIAVRDWAWLVTDTENDLKWALIQGQIWFAYTVFDS